MWIRQCLLTVLIFVTILVNSCSTSSCPQESLNLGIITYDPIMPPLENYQTFQKYLGAKTCSFVNLEPSLNELNAIDRIKKKDWSLVFAPPGLVAIAMDQEQYIPIFTLASLPNQRSVIIVNQDSSFQTLSDLNNQIIGLGQPGSATGYYLPLYDLYGLTLAEVRFSRIPKNLLQWLANNEVKAVALSEDEFQEYGRDFPADQFRILHKTRPVVSGAVLLSPTVDRKQEEQIRQAMKEANASIVANAGYVIDAPIPDYREFIKFVQKVRPLESKLKQKPVVLSSDNND
jgi:phosphonate transport system substrate-binding protein